MDPAGVLNRGTIITDDPKLHLKEVKLELDLLEVQFRVVGDDGAAVEHSCRVH